MNGILFDLDGTLWDACETMLEAWNRTLAEKYPELRRTLTLAELQSGMGKTREENAGRLFPELPHDRALEVVETACADEIPVLRERGGILYPGVTELLAGLKDRYRVGIVSNCQCGYIEAFLEAHDLAPLFRDHECFGRTGRGKAENIRILLERQGARDAVYVGDTAGDEASAAAAGIPFIHAAYGFGKAESPAAVIRRVTELPEVLKALENR